jgi:hypothetical protein
MHAFMLLLSLSPLRLRKLSWSLSTSIGFVSVCCVAQTMFFAVNSTPYDHQMSRVYSYISIGPQIPAKPISAMEIDEWMSALRAIPYRYSPQWKTPDEIAFEQTADCKGKALILFERMREMGARNLRFVIGKRRLDSVQTHAWVEWDTRGGTILLDPTFNSTWATETQTGYIPFYAYDGAYRYRAAQLTFASTDEISHTVAAPAQGSIVHRKVARRQR